MCNGFSLFLSRGSHLRPAQEGHEQILDVRPVTPDATQSGCYYLGHSHSRRGQEGPKQLSGMLSARRDAVDSVYSCTQGSDLRRNKGPEHNINVLAMPCSVESCRPCPWSLHLRYAQEGPGQLLNILAMPDAMESSRVQLSLPSHLHVRHVQEKLEQLPDARIVTPHVVEYSHYHSSSGHPHLRCRCPGARVGRGRWGSVGGDREKGGRSTDGCGGRHPR